MAFYDPNSNQHSDGSDTVCSPRKRKTTNPITLDTLLESVQVNPPGMWENGVSDHLDGWYAVSTDDGIIVYFWSERDAFRFRLDYINRILNP